MIEPLGVFLRGEQGIQWDFPGGHSFCKVIYHDGLAVALFDGVKIGGDQVGLFFQPLALRCTVQLLLLGGKLAFQTVFQGGDVPYQLLGGIF